MTEFGYAGVLVVQTKTNPIILPESGRPVEILPRLWRVRPVVGAFAVLLEGVLKKHDDREGWQNVDPRWLFNRMIQETQEMHSALSQLAMAHPDHAAETTMQLLTQTLARKAANVANFAMMITDVTGGLDIDSPLLAGYSTNGFPGLAGTE